MAARVSDFFFATGRIREVIADLKEELDSLYSDIDNMTSICHNPEFKPAATMAQEGSQNRIFTHMQANLDSCTHTVNRLSDLIGGIYRGSSNKIMNRARAQLRLEESEGEINKYQKQIQTHRGSTQLSVSALTL